MGKIEVQQTYPKIKNLRVVLSEKVYERLSGCINLCGYHMGKDNFEFGTVLYGFRKDNIVYFEKASDLDDYEPKPKAFSLSNNMIEELIQSVDKSLYNCFAMVHTHPYITEPGRFFSEQDLEYFKTSFNFSKLFPNKELSTLGCLLSITSKNTKETDDISFIEYDNDLERFYYIPSISVYKDGKEYELNQVEDEVITTDGTNKRIKFERILFDRKFD